jgi:hypothetical protein
MTHFSVAYQTQDLTVTRVPTSFLERCTRIAATGQQRQPSGHSQSRPYASNGKVGQVLYTVVPQLFFFVQVPGVTLQHNTTQHKVAPGSYQGRLRLLPSRREACGLFSYTETSFWGSAVFGSERGTSQHGLAVSEMRICGY